MNDLSKAVEREELLPCPFCGREARVGQWATWYVRCSECRAEQIGLTKGEATSAWNARPAASTTADLQQEVVRLKEELTWIMRFAEVRAADDSKTFARVNRGALRTIAQRSSAALSTQAKEG